MSRFLKRLLSLLCAAALLAGLVSLSASALENAQDGEAEAEGPFLLTCTEIPLYTGRRYIGSGFLVDSVTYVPLLAFVEFLLKDECAVEWEWEQETETVTIRSDELTIHMTVSDDYLEANGRYIYFESGAYNINGTIMVPLSEIAKVFTLDYAWDEENWMITLDRKSAQIWESAEDFYDGEDLKWLSRVIYAEAGNQPIAGKIGVGNVVVNRANDTTGAFKNTIHDVIFQIGQFSVVESGAIYLDPNEESVVAAKLTLEGYNTVGESKWYHNPQISTTTWFDKNKTYACSIADHAFYY